MPAPYRVDLFNRLSNELDLDVYFQRSEINYHRALDQQSLRASMRCRTATLPCNRVVFDRDVPFGLGGFLRSRDPDVVVTMEFSGVSLLTKWAMPAQGRRFGHVIWSDENPWTFAAHGVVRRRLRGFCSARADAMIMCSNQVADLFARQYGFPRERIHHCAVHQASESVRARLVAAGSAEGKLIGELGVSGKRIMLYVGRLAPEKNLHTAIEGFASVFGNDASVIFLIVGTGTLRTELEQCAIRAGIGDRVRFAGHREGAELYGCFRMASFLLLTSIHEPYGAVVNEALICGVPVVCTDRAGAVQLIRPGVNGEVIDPHNTATLNRALESMRPNLATVERHWGCLRGDLMPVSFEDDVRGFVSAVRAAACRAGRLTDSARTCAGKGAA